MENAKRVAPAAERNRDPILEVLERVLPPAGLVLELGSGTGQHVIHFARALPGLDWLPSDPDPSARASIAAWIAESGLNNVQAPYSLDAETGEWPRGPFAALLAINVIHISAWSVAEAIVRGAASALEPKGVLFLYGPYKKGGRHTAPSNEAFDGSLRARDPRWGVRELDEVIQLATREGLRLDEEVAMPANNLSLVFRRPVAV